MNNAHQNQILKNIEKLGFIPIHGGGYFQPRVLDRAMLEALERFMPMPESAQLARHHRAIIQKFSRSICGAATPASDTSKTRQLKVPRKLTPRTALRQTRSGKAKVKAYLNFLKGFPEFKPDWERLLDIARPWGEVMLWDSVYRFSAVQATSPELKEFNRICDRWYLEGIRISDKEPILLEPAVSVDATGTRLHIPGYFPADFARDIDWSQLRAAHHAHGARRLGEKLLKNRAALRKQELLTCKADKAAKARGLRGEKRMRFIKEEAGLDYRTDDARVRLLIRRGRALGGSS